MTEGQSKTWQELGDEFHMVVGYCIAEWASVDDELFRIFRHCIGPYEQSAIIYYKTPGLEPRLSLTDEIVISVLPKPARKSGGHDLPEVTAWKAAITDFRNLLAIRRRIAHHPVAIRQQPLAWDVSRFDLPPPSWFEIYVNEHEQFRTGEIPALKVEDLKVHLLALTLLRDRLHHFFYDVLIKLKPTSAAPSPPPPTAKSQQTDHATKP